MFPPFWNVCKRCNWIYLNNPYPVKHYWKRLLTRNILMLRTCFYDIPRQMTACQSSPVVNVWPGTILNWIEVHTCKLHSCFSFNQPFKIKCPWKCDSCSCLKWSGKRKNIFKFTGLYVSPVKNDRLDYWSFLTGHRFVWDVVDTYSK